MIIIIGQSWQTNHAEWWWWWWCRLSLESAVSELVRLLVDWIPVLLYQQIWCLLFISAEEEEEQQQQPLFLQEFQEIDSAQQQERGVVVQEIRENGIRGRRSSSSFSSSSSRWSRRKFDRIQHYRLQEVSWRSWESHWDYSGKDWRVFENTWHACRNCAGELYCVGGCRGRSIATSHAALALIIIIIIPITDQAKTLDW